MIYRRAFFAEAGINVCLLALVLGGLASMIFMGRLITETVSVSSGALITLLGLQLVKITPQLLTVSLFAGLVITFNRMSQARELDAWNISGLRDRHWYTVVLAFAVPVALSIWILALHIAPWSIRHSEQFQDDLAERLRLEDTAPGIFGEIKDQQLIYHLGALSPDRSSALGIFVARRDTPESIQLILAEKAETKIDGLGLRDLIMEKGELHNISFADGISSNVSFDRAEFRLGREEQIDSVRLRAYPLDQLGNDTNERVEYLWRHSFAAVVVLLALFAIPLGRLSPGSGRSYQVLLAVLTYWLYYALAAYAKDLGEGGEITPEMAAFAPLALIAVPLVAFYVHRWLRPMR